MKKSSWLILAVAAIGITIYVLNARSATPSAAATPYDRTTAFLMCQKFIQQRLTSPGSADYPFGASTGGDDLGGGRYRFRGYLDSQNGFGALIRSTYDCSIKWAGGSDWELERLEMQ
jgi:hypothetical protein